MKNYDDNLFYNNFFKLTFAVFISLILTSIDWEFYIGGNNFQWGDRLRYINYFKYFDNVISYSVFNNFFDYISREYLWHYGISYLIKNFGFSIESILSVITFYCFSIFIFFTVKHKGYLSFFLVLNPLVLVLAFDQSRSALAVSLLYVGLLCNKKTIYFIVISASIFIHSVAFLIVVMFFSLSIVYYFFNKKIINFAFFKVGVFFIGFLASIFSGSLKNYLLGLVNDRRADYGDSSSSLLYASFWIILFFIFLFQDKNFFRDKINACSLIFLSIAATSPITGSYTTRFIALSFPLIIVSILSIKGDMRNVTIIGYLSYCVFQWIYFFRVGW